MLAALLVLGLFQAQAAPEWELLPREGAPPARADETIIWSGAEFLVWGGVDAKDVYLDSGAAYDPVKRTWRSLPRDGAPSARAWHTAVWSGAEMLVWGGVGDDEEAADGAAYDPAKNSWRPLSKVNAPDARGSHVAVWIPRGEMLVWGGVTDFRSFASGARYSPSKDEWTPFEIDTPESMPRTMPGVWTGAEFLTWGGINGSSVLGHGVTHDLRANAGSAITSEGAPRPRAYHALVWNGREVIIWGGSRSITGGMALGDGALLDPRTKKWTPIPAGGGPGPRYSHGFALRGAELLILGGAVEAEGDALRDAWARSADGSWNRLPDLPAGRAAGHAFSTEHGVFFLGGRDAAMKLHSGGFFLSAR